MALQDPVAVYYAATNAEAQVVRSLLVDAGIEAFAVDDVSVGGTWTLGLIPEIHKPQVWVDRRNVEQARSFIAGYEQRSAERESGDDFCYECGEPVGYGISTCPACGQSLDLEAPENSERQGRGNDSEANSAVADVRLDFLRSFKKPLAWLFVGPLLLVLGLTLVMALFEAIHPMSLTAHINRGIAWQTNGDFDKALADYTEAIRIDPECEQAFYRRGIVWQAKGELDRAISDYSEAIRLEPEFAEAHYNRGTVWERKRDLNKAIADYDQTIHLDPTIVFAYNNRGVAWFDKGELDKAIADYSKAIRLDPKLAFAFSGRGIVWSAKREFDKAIADFDEAIRLDPKRVPAYNGRAWLRATCSDEKYRDGASAVEDATTACELMSWNDFQSLETLAAAYAEAGDFVEAVDCQEKAIELAHDDKKEGCRIRLKLYKEGKPNVDSTRR